LIFSVSRLTLFSSLLSNNPNNANSNDSNHSPSSVNPAVIGGAVGGAVALVVIFGGLALWYTRRYKRKVDEKYVGGVGSAQYGSSKAQGESAYVTEMDAQAQMHEKP